MPKNKIIIEQTRPNGSLPRQDFIKEDFDLLIYQKGYNVYHEKATLCPCKIKGQDNKPDCLNCGGTGWIFLDKIKTRMILHSMNIETKYKEWSEEKVGTVSISCMDKDQISFMDRITLIDSRSLHSQILYPQFYQNKLFAYTSYIIQDIKDCFLFINSKEKLKRLTIGTDYTYENNVFYLDNKYQSMEALRVSIRYAHYVAYHVIDISRDIINSFNVNAISGKEGLLSLPLHGTARRAHYILDGDKFNSEYILDNSSLTSPTNPC